MSVVVNANHLKMREILMVCYITTMSVSIYFLLCKEFSEDLNEIQAPLSTM